MSCEAILHIVPGGRLWCCTVVG